MGRLYESPLLEQLQVEQVIYKVQKVGNLVRSQFDYSFITHVMRQKVYFR